MLMKINKSFSRVRFRNSSGRSRLSAIPAIPPQIPTTNSALPQCPVNPNHKAAGTQTSPEPTTGMIEQKPISNPRKTGAEIPDERLDFNSKVKRNLRMVHYGLVPELNLAGGHTLSDPDP